MGTKPKYANIVLTSNFGLPKTIQVDFKALGRIDSFIQNFDSLKPLIFEILKIRVDEKSIY